MSKKKNMRKKSRLVNSRFIEEKTGWSREYIHKLHREGKVESVLVKRGGNKMVLYDLNSERFKMLGRIK